MNTHRGALSALSCLLWLLLIGNLAWAADTPRQTLPAVAEPFPAPEFELKDIDGRTHRLSDYRGKVVILNFWATWCPPCIKEMPSMERARQMIEDEDIAILAINVGEDEDSIFMFTGNYPVEFPLLMDLEAETIKQYPVTGLPTTYIIDPTGRATHRVVGSREWDDPQLLDSLRAILMTNPGSVTGQ